MAWRVFIESKDGQKIEVGVYKTQHAAEAIAKAKREYPSTFKRLVTRQWHADAQFVQEELARH